MRQHRVWALLIWALFVPLGILNGVLREIVLVPTLGARPALPLSGILLAALILGLVHGLLPRLGPITFRQAWRTGALWLLLTVAFEFGFGRLVAGTPWPELFAAYTFAEGNLWLGVLLVILCAPRIAMALRGEKKEPAP